MTDGGPSRADPARLMLREVWGTGDVDLLDELVTDDHVHHDPTLSGRVRGRDALKGVVERRRDGTPDLEIAVEDTFVDGVTVVITYTAGGTHEGELLGMEPTGCPIDVEGVYICEVEDGRLRATTDLWDAYGVLKQIGGLPEAE